MSRQQSVRISLVTPAHQRSRSGNRTTADRWAGILRGLGHRVTIATSYNGASADLLIALHAWRSAESIRHFHRRFPEKPIIVGLGGTDVYQNLHSDPATTEQSMALADALVGLHDLIAEALPERFRAKVRVIHQSAEPPLRRLPPLKRAFEVLVIAHLREVKDPLRAAYAARKLTQDSRIRIIHFGKALEDSWATAAYEEMVRNPRYCWKGEAPGWLVRRALARAPLLVLSSLLEGGANVVSEAVVAGVPVIASGIPGSVGLLGRHYPGYFPVGDTAALASLLSQAEADPAYLEELRRHCLARAPLFSRVREIEAWRGLLNEIRAANRKLSVAAG